MKKIICSECIGRGYIKIEDIHEHCQVCKGNGYLLYAEEGEAFGNDCVGGRCEV
jgi:DnaJ-class molecular chaperone